MALRVVLKEDLREALRESKLLIVLLLINNPECLPLIFFRIVMFYHSFQSLLKSALVVSPTDYC